MGTATNWKNIDCGDSLSIATRTDGTLWTWGQHSYMQLGYYASSDEEIPTQVGTGTNWNLVVGGYHHSGAIRLDNSLWVWGDNYNGELGDGTTTFKTSPQALNCYTSTLDVAEIANNDLLQAYPNPVQAILHITASENIQKVVIYNLMGQEVLQQTFDSNAVDINVESLFANVYFVKVVSGSHESTLKIIKK